MRPRGAHAGAPVPSPHPLGPEPGSAVDPLHRLALVLSLAVAAPLGAAALYSRDWLPAIPFVLAVVCPAAALYAIRPSRPARLLGTLWPVVLWPLLYDAAVRIVSHYPERYIDDWLLAADRVLFFGHTPDRWPLGGPIEELANLFYASYYVMIPLCALWIALRRGDVETVRYGLAIVATFGACALIWLVAPSGGYHLDGSPDGAAYGPFTALMRWIYAQSPHYAAAFPSSHVALAFAAAAFSTRLGGSRWLWFWAAGIAWSTVQGQYHYAVDAPPAVILGIAIGRWAHRTHGLAARPFPPGLRGMLPHRQS